MNKHHFNYPVKKTALKMLQLTLLLTLYLKIGTSSLYSQQSLLDKAPFNNAYVDKTEWRDLPVRHQYIHGGFKGTDTRFSFYLPEKANYKGRFFQYITPIPDNETLSQGAKGQEDKIGFCLSHGAYFIETNGGGNSSEPLVGAYLANAATAEYSRVVAAGIYGKHRPFGYAFGGSGGAYRTVGGLENTEAWDGAVPYVLGSSMAIPNVFTVRMHAMRILYDKFPKIIDALEPGGSGNMYEGLNEEEAAALREVTKMGFPPQAWFGYKNMGIHGFLVLYQGVVASDPTYFNNDFWSKPGYLGANPTQSLLNARIQKVTTIKAGITFDQAVQLGLKDPVSEQERGSADAAWKSVGGSEGGMPVAFQIDTPINAINFLGGDLIIKSGAAAGKVLQIAKIEGDKLVLGPVDNNVLALIKPGDKVQVDNSNFLAVQTYHRHQVPGKEFHVWDQFRDTNGNPIYPQRAQLIAPGFTIGAGGALPTGKFKGKMILLESLWDREALAWQADWYRTLVKENLGNATDDNFRLWYTDHALHGDIAVEDDPTRTVGYLGTLQQALLDLSDWVEKGIPPATNTVYKVEDGQVVVPETANKRKSIQPVVTVKVNGGKRADVKVGDKVTFTAIVEVPKNYGKVARAAWNIEGLPENMGASSGWDFEESGVFSLPAKITSSRKKGGRVKIKLTYTFTKPGTYFPTLRATSQRDGDAKTPYTQIHNLDRVRVVVK